VSGTLQQAITAALASLQRNDVKMCTTVKVMSFYAYISSRSPWLKLRMRRKKKEGRVKSHFFS